MDKTVAMNILQQLGGNRFIVFTGSSNFVALKNGLICKLARNSSHANYMKVELTPMDVYKVSFLYSSVRGIKVKKVYDDVYCDDLQNVFEQTTGLYTHL